MLKANTTQAGGNVPRTRQRNSTSCIECKRRKQKCDQAKGKPCSNCSRRYPPVRCVYEVNRKALKNSVTVVGLGNKVKVGPADESISGLSQRCNPSGESDLTADVPFHGLYTVPSAPVVSVGSIDYTRPPNETSAPISTVVRCLEPAPRIGEHRDHVLCDKRQPPRSQSPYFSYPDNCETSCFGFLRTPINPLLEPLYHLPLEPTRRNAELCHIFIHRLSPYMTSIDGKMPNAEFNNEYIHFVLHSSMNAYIPVLTTAYFNAIADGIDVEKSVEAISARFKIITLINEHLNDQRRGISDEVLSSVMSMAYNELIYTDKKTVMAHMKGLKSMIRTRGGIENIQKDILRKLLLRTDYLVASVFECNPFFDYEKMDRIPCLTNYPLQLDNPFLQSNTRFGDFARAFQLSNETARILDDIRFLTDAVLSMGRSQVSELQEDKLFATASWIYKRLCAPVEKVNSSDFLYQSCRVAATIFTLAVLTRTPFSQACTSELLSKLWAAQWRVPLTRWKRIPGVFLWMALTAAPFAQHHPMGRWYKGMIASSIIATGLLDWEVAMGTLRAFLAVQRWLGGGETRKLLRPLS